MAGPRTRRAGRGDAVEGGLEDREARPGLLGKSSTLSRILRLGPLKADLGLFRFSTALLRDAEPQGLRSCESSKDYLTRRVQLTRLHVRIPAARGRAALETRQPSLPHRSRQVSRLLLALFLYGAPILRVFPVLQSYSLQQRDC